MARNVTPYRGGGLLGGWEPFSSLHREMNRLFDEAMGGGMPMAGAQGQGGMGNLVNAQMDVSETENEIRVCAELPGVTEKDIDVSLDGDMLTIRGEKRFERKDDKENYHFMERSYGTFQRSLRLPFQADPDQVRADFDNGVLTVTVPKTGQKERTRRIQVQRGPGGGQQQIGQEGQGSQEKQGGESR